MANFTGQNTTIGSFSYGVPGTTGATETTSAAFGYTLQSPLPGAELLSAGFNYVLQNPLGGAELYSAQFQYTSANPANAVYLSEPAVGFGDVSSTDAVYLASGTTTNVVAIINYYQRVYSSGLNLWCYYTTQNGVDPSPLPTSTVPNWTGSITGYELITSLVA